jgi:tRNA(Ile)-lysidine synthase
MIRPGEGVLAAVSGGGDSVLMLHLLAALRGEIPFTLKVAHLNHGLRGAESDADEAFTEALARRLSLEFTRQRADLSREPGDPSSVEERAREARRAFLSRAAREAGCARIALGHTLDDQAETILMWLLRGTGRGGMAGMEPVTGGGIIRPLLQVRRSAVRDHLREMGEPYRDDSSNEDRARTRNLLRAEILPLLDRHFPGGVERLAATAGTVSGEEAVLDEMAEQLLIGPDGGLDAPGASETGPRRALAARAVRRAAARPGMDPRLLHRDHVEAILALSGRGSEGRGVDLPGGYRAVIRRGTVHFLVGERKPPSGR